MHDEFSDNQTCSRKPIVVQDLLPRRAKIDRVEIVIAKRSFQM